MRGGPTRVGGGGLAQVGLWVAEIMGISGYVRVVDILFSEQ